MELCQPGCFDSPCQPSVVAGLRVLLAEDLAEFPLGALLVAEDLVPAQRSSLIQGWGVEALRSAVVRHPPSAQDLKCHKNG